jgi:hypothetical protein
MKTLILALFLVPVCGFASSVSFAINNRATYCGLDRVDVLLLVYDTLRAELAPNVSNGGGDLGDNELAVDSKELVVTVSFKRSYTQQELSRVGERLLEKMTKSYDERLKAHALEQFKKMRGIRESIEREKDIVRSRILEEYLRQWYAKTSGGPPFLPFKIVAAVP